MRDIYGRSWPNVSANESCPVCGQPDNCGDCEHGRLTDDEVILLGGEIGGGRGGKGVGADGAGCDPHG